jgi:hypothetical protein
LFVFFNLRYEFFTHCDEIVLVLTKGSRMKKISFTSFLICSLLFSGMIYGKNHLRNASFIVPSLYNYGDHLFISVWNYLNGPIICTGQIQFSTLEGKEYRYIYEEAPPRMISSYTIFSENPEGHILSFSHDIICY